MATSNPGPAVTTTPEPQAAMGNIYKNAVISASITPAAVGAATTAVQSFSIPALGVVVGDQVSAVSPPAATPAGQFVVGAAVTAADTVAITFGNVTAGSTPPAGVYQFEVNRVQTNVSFPSGYLNQF
jgi:hypothetical protein